MEKEDDCSPVDTFSKKIMDTSESQKSKSYFYLEGGAIQKMSILSQKRGSPFGRSEENFDIEQMEGDISEQDMAEQEINNALVIQELADRLNALSVEHSGCKTDAKKVNPYEESMEKVKQFRKRSSSGKIEESWKIEQEEVSPSPMFSGREVASQLKRLNLFVSTLLLIDSRTKKRTTKIKFMSWRRRRSTRNRAR